MDVNNRSLTGLGEKTVQLPVLGFFTAQFRLRLTV